MPAFPLVSIVTPSYNQGRFLEATIRSVLEQVYPAIEYILVDGGSTDASVEIIQRYADCLAWWVSEKDGGQAEALNKGLRRAQGEIIGWLNSDDIYLPGALASVLAAFEAHPEAGLVYGDALSIDAQGKPFNHMRSRPHTLLDLLSFSIISQPAVFMRRSVLQQVDYLDPTYHFLLDHDLWIRIARQYPIVYIPQTWAGARYHALAKNRTFGAACGQEARRLITTLGLRPEFESIIALHKKRIWAGVDRFDAFYLTDAGKPGQALRLYFHAFRLHPATALRDWKHILLALFSLLGLGRLRRLYDWLRTCAMKKA